MIFSDRLREVGFMKIYTVFERKIVLFGIARVEIEKAENAT